MMHMEDDLGYDIRGRQSAIFRLFCFDKEGLAHMLFYRIAIFVSMFLIASIMIGLYFYGTALILTSKALIMLIWILFMPQLFETGKAMSIIATDGAVFNRFNASFIQFGLKKKRAYIAFLIFPYLLLLIWIVGLLVMLGSWFA